MKYEQSIVGNHFSKLTTFTSGSPESFRRQDDTLNREVEEGKGRRGDKFWAFFGEQDD